MKIINSNKNNKSISFDPNSNSKYPHGISEIGRKKFLRISLSPGVYEFVDDSDDFKNIKNNESMVFAGCSITAGESLNAEDTWAKKVYTKILKSSKGLVAGYYNIAASGMSVSECIDQVFKYCNQYGNPKIIFMILPDPWRDSKYAEEYCVDTLSTLIYRCYFYLDQYCKSNNIQLITTTWYKDSALINTEALPKGKMFYPGTNEPRPHWGDQLNKNKANLLDKLLKDFSSYYIYSEKDMIDSVYEHHSSKNKEDKKYSLVASDNIHPGTSFHDFWSEFMYLKYEELEIEDI